MLLSKDLRRLNNLYIKAIVAEIPDISFEAVEIILHIASLNKAVSQKLICESLSINQLRMVKLINEMVKNNLVYTGPNPVDKSARLVMLTDNGTKLVHGLKQAVEKVNLIIFDKLEVSDLVNFYKTIEQVEQNLS